MSLAEALGSFRMPADDTMWLLDPVCGKHRDRSCGKDDVEFELDRLEHPTLSSSDGKEVCADPTSCSTQCTHIGVEECSVKADGCRSCILWEFDLKSGDYTWKRRTYATLLADWVPQPCFSCGEWDGMQADPEMATMYADGVKGMSTVAIDGRQWTRDALDPYTAEGRKFATAFRAGVAAWIEASSRRRYGQGATPIRLPADRVHMKYVTNVSASQARQEARGALYDPLQFSRAKQFALVQWQIAIDDMGSEADASADRIVGSAKVMRMQQVIQFACADTTSLSDFQPGSPRAIDFDTAEFGFLGFTALDCLVNRRGTVDHEWVRLGSVLGEYYSPGVSQNTAVYAVVAVFCALVVAKAGLRASPFCRLARSWCD